VRLLQVEEEHHITSALRAAQQQSRELVLSEVTSKRRSIIGSTSMLTPLRSDVRTRSFTQTGYLKNILAMRRADVLREQKELHNLLGTATFTASDSEQV
jgi:hypothetical protein